MKEFFLCEEFIGYGLKRALLVLEVEFHKALHEFNVTPVVLTMLLKIAEQPGITSSQLGKLLAIQSSNMVSLVRGIQSEGWAKSALNLEDKRAKGLYLTRQGHMFLLNIESLAMASDLTATRGLTDKERVLLSTLLKKVYQSSTA